MSQAQLAGEELTKGFISQLESGLVRPSIRSLQVIATRLGRSLDYFVADQPLTTAKRVVFQQLAAEAAAERGDFAAARAAVEAGLAESTESRERAALLRIAAAADVAAGDNEAAFDRVAKALAMIDTAAEPLIAAQLLQMRGAAYGQHGQMVAAAEAFEAARDIMEKHEVNDPRLRARVLIGLGTAYRRLNRTAKALQIYESALALATRASELRTAAQGYMGVAVSLYDAGELDGAITNYQRALQLFERIADAELELSVLQSLAAVHFEHGDIAKARELAERCLARANFVNDARFAAVAQTELARVLLAGGDAAGAVAKASDAERALAAAGDDQQRAYALRILGAAYDALADYAASDRAYRKAIALDQAVAIDPDVSATAAEYAQKLRARGEIDQAFTYLEMSRAPSGRR